MCLNHVEDKTLLQAIVCQYFNVIVSVLPVKICRESANMSLRRITKRNFLYAKLVTENRMPCAFCRREVDDELIYGKLYALGDIQCHYFCVLLSSCLVQKGKDTEGLFGFMYKDIVAEVERSKKHKCSYCGIEGATLGCAIAQCRKQFHLPCGRERNAVSLFYGNYKSFCQMHAHKQKIPDVIMDKARVRKREANKKIKGILEICKSANEQHKLEPECVCVICYEEVEAYPTLQTFWPPCCARDAWFHRTCLQRMALSAGMHYLKCPLCNDKENFYEAVIEQGYYVPDRDAAWELEQNAFSEIYERELKCSAETCLCPNGRNHDAEEGCWDIMSCLLCGSAGWHRACAGEHAVLAARAPVAVCRTCRPAAPHQLNELTDAIQAVIEKEQAESRVTARPCARPLMSSRMSLRRTKRDARNTASTSTLNVIEDHRNKSSSRKELGLKSPKKLSQPQTIEFTSPTKLIEQGVKQKIENLGVKLNLDNVLDEVKQRLKKPKPLCEKRKAIETVLDNILDNALKDPKHKEAPKEWCSPKKDGFTVENIEELEIQQGSGHQNPEIQAESDDSSSTFQLPSEFIADTSDDTPIHTPKKLKTVDIQKDSSLEISANDQSVNIDMVKLEDNDNGDFLNSLTIKSPVKSKKCMLKFSPLDKEVLQENNIGIDLECFKNHYLNEVVREVPESFSATVSRKRKIKDRIKKGGKRRKTDFKLKFDGKLIKKGRKLKKKVKTRVSISNDNIRVKINWKTKQLNLKIMDKKKKIKNKQPKLKQYVLQYTQDCVRDVLVKPEKEVSPLKRKYVKHEKSADNLVQTSIQSFFTVKSTKD